jgi:hypothetical protein
MQARSYLPEDPGPLVWLVPGSDHVEQVFEVDTAPERTGLGERLIGGSFSGGVVALAWRLGAA